MWKNCGIFSTQQMKWPLVDSEYRLGLGGMAAGRPSSVPSATDVLVTNYLLPTDAHVSNEPCKGILFKMKGLFCPILSTICCSGCTNFPNHLKICSSYKGETSLFHSSVVYGDSFKQIQNVFLHVKLRTTSIRVSWSYICHQMITSLTSLRTPTHFFGN